jgi:hypothetical protein
MKEEDLRYTLTRKTVKIDAVIWSEMVQILFIQSTHLSEVSVLCVYDTKTYQIFVKPVYKGL